MVRLRYNLEEATAAAREIALRTIIQHPEIRNARLASLVPTQRVSKSRASKHPTRWTAMFTFQPEQNLAKLERCTIDGGEIIVIVDLEAMTGQIVS